MPYAGDNKLCTEPFAGAVEITDAEYLNAIQAIADGKRVIIVNGQLAFETKQTRTVYSIADGKPVTEEFWPEDPVRDEFTTLPRPSPEHWWDADSTCWKSSADYTLAERREQAVLTRAAFKLALLSAGFLEDIESQYDTWDKSTKIMWDDSLTFERLHPEVIRFAEQMGYTDEQLDDMFGVV